MDKRRQKRLACLDVAACSLAVVLSGCLSYRTGGLPNAELDTQRFTLESKPTAFVEVACQTRSLNETALGKSVAGAQQFRGILADVFRASEPFKSYTFSASRSTNANLRIVANLTTEMDGSVVNLLLSVGTLGAIPATQTTTHQLTMQVYDSTGEKKAEYEVKDSMKAWFQLLLLPLGPWKSPDKTERQLMENLVRTTLSRMKADGFLSLPH